MDPVVGDDGHPFDLLKLPERARTSLLKHLSVWNLMNLRLVCKDVKAWVENPDVLKRLCVHVKQRNFLKKLIKSNVKWSNLMMLCDTNDVTSNWIQSEDYLRTFAKLNTSLRILKFAEQRLAYNRGLDMILSNCTQLQTLEIGTLDLSNADLPVNKRVLESLATLETLTISYVAWETEKDLQFFPEILSGCKNLRVFKIPFILQARMYSLYPDSDEDEIDQKHAKMMEQMLFKPLKHMLQDTDRKCSLRFLDVENCEFEQILGGLASACKQAGCLLLNVVEALEAPLPQKQKEFFEIIASLMNCSVHLDLTRLKNLASIIIDADSAQSSDINKTMKDAPLPALKDVTLTLTNSILQSERFASCFLQQKRDSLESVSVNFQDLKGSAQASVFRSPKFATSLQFLRSLSLDGFDGNPEDYFLFWNNFSLLESLKLQNCRTLTDNCLIGPDRENPTLLKLKHLTKVTIEDGELTDSSLEVVFPKIDLEVLILALPKVTNAGLLYLKTGILGKSLMVFQCIQPEDCSDQHFKDMLKCFENLKKHELLF
ncbi:unnamed protein product [Orchesella dallaii]|uniref:F-box domain-containing protein n=1 Tax=Orchesella dallaii TaxID=48710 RepID=A0ABP1S505_9HEXA